MPIRHRDVILTIPYDLLLSIDKAKADPVLGPVFAENAVMFGSDNPDHEQLTLCVFLMYEWQKGKEGKWWPYIDLMPEVTFFCDWAPSAVHATQDEGLMKDAVEFKGQLETEWNLLLSILRMYVGKVFKPATLKR